MVHAGLSGLTFTHRRVASSASMSGGGSLLPAGRRPSTATSSRPAAASPPLAVPVGELDLLHEPFKPRSLSIAVQQDDGGDDHDDDGGVGEGGEGTPSSGWVDLPGEPVLMTQHREEWLREKYYDEPKGE